MPSEELRKALDRLDDILSKALESIWEFVEQFEDLFYAPIESDIPDEKPKNRSLRHLYRLPKYDFKPVLRKNEPYMRRIF